jgi:outer membrane protein TolC
MTAPVPSRLALAAAALLLAGCAGVTPRDTFRAGADLARPGAGAEARIAYSDDERRALASDVAAMLQAPLDIDAAVRLALINHPGLQATYQDAGIAQADLVQATRLRNPSFGFSRMSGGGEHEIERGVAFDLAGLLTMPLRQRMAARQALDYARQVAAAADAASDLSARMRRAGNASALDLAREQAFHAEAAAGVLRAGRTLDNAREALTRQLGLWGEQTGYALPERLPDLPPTPAMPANLERLALERRLDVRAARAAAAGTASDLGLTRTTRMVNVLDLGYASKSETNQARSDGYEIALELPLFDWGGARVARAEALYMASVQRVAQTAVDARSEARAGYLAYRASYDVARHYREHVLPLRKRIADETLLRYNGMLASPFELLADAREQAGAVHAAIEALREFWLADSALRAALGGPADTPPAPSHHHHPDSHAMKEPTP